MDHTQGACFPFQKRCCVTFPSRRAQRVRCFPLPSSLYRTGPALHTDEAPLSRGESERAHPEQPREIRLFWRAAPLRRGGLWCRRSSYDPSGVDLARSHQPLARRRRPPPRRGLPARRRSMDDFSLRPTRLARSFSSGKVVRPEEETGGFSPRPIRLSRSSPDLGKTFPDKEEYLEKKITFLEEFKSATSFAGLLRTPLCIPDEPFGAFTNTNYDEYFGDGDYDDLFNNNYYEGYDEDYDDIFSNTISNRSAPTDDGTSSPALLHVPSDLETMLQDQSSRPHNIPLRDLKEITNNFSDERILGQGGFGVVYKGVLRNGEMIAVKKIVSSLMPGLQKQFESEVYHLMMLKHPNIVRCIGYCYETRNECLEYNGQYVFAEMAERLLCLEYLPKGSLDKYLSDESSRLDWSTCYKIIEGICYGLCHLHEQIDKSIIHLDLKPANILLDDSLVPKITDFGLSRLFGQQQTICTSSRIGTFGYMAPEFLHGGTITPKLDIFSLGVIIMEIITGHRDYPGVTGTSSDDFIELALEKWRNVLQRSPGYGSLERDCEQIKRCIQVGLICVNPDRTKRPPIAKIINMLQGSENIDYDISNEAA